MMSTAAGERTGTTATGVRGSARRNVRPRAERARDARVDLGCLPRFLGFNLRRAHLCSWRRYVAVIGENNIRPGLFSLLVLVGSNPGIAQIELGTHLGIDKASIVALLDRLEKDGMLDRHRSTRDRRRQGIFLTERGAQALDSLVAQVRSLERQMASRFTRAEFEQFLGYLQRVYS
ncbi:MAG: MarR family transcriptional regulator [Gammaproteobacteria bacterium]|nr:MarR family transcriptional regulator [Gammaproteobacteria bacterium]